MGLFDRLRGGGGDDPRVVFLGIDGVPYDLVADHPDVFETLHRLTEEGTGGRIDSIVPPESSACWPSLTTGVNPGKTGVYGFQDREVGSYETYVPMGEDVRATRLWDRVTEAGRDATVLNVPVTFPPQRDVQRMVSGFLSPSIEDAAGDPDVRRTLERFDYRIDVDAKPGHDDDKTEFLENARETLDARYAVFDHYLEEDDWDLFFGVFMSTDRVNHFLFGDYANDEPDAERFLEFYRTLDNYIGRIHDALDDDVSLVVASDHGFTELVHEVNCNRWLADEGYLTYEPDEPDEPEKPTEPEKPGKTDEPEMPGKADEPEMPGKADEPEMPGKADEPDEPEKPNELGDIGADTQVYSLIPGRFFINLAGREPAGAVSEADYEAVRDRLIDDLEAMTGPDGSAVCARIHRGEEVFDGPATDIAPDVVVVPEDGFDLKSSFGGKDAVFTTGPRNGMHAFSNACLFTDDDRVTIDDVDLLDVAPTLLDLLDVDAPDAEFDGRSLVRD